MHHRRTKKINCVNGSQHCCGAAIMAISAKVYRPLSSRWNENFDSVFQKKIMLSAIFFLSPILEKRFTKKSTQIALPFNACSGNACKWIWDWRTVQWMIFWNISKRKTFLFWLVLTAKGRFLLPQVHLCCFCFFLRWRCTPPQNVYACKVQMEHYKWVWMAHRKLHIIHNINT